MVDSDEASLRRFLLGAGGVLALLLILSACAATPSSPPEPDQLVLRDVAANVGVDFTQSAFRWGPSADPIAMMGGGVCWLDYDNDGWMDLYAVNTYSLDEYSTWIDEGGLPRNALYRNTGGTFEDVSAPSGADLSVRGSGCVVGDLNNDGFIDIYVTTARSNALLWNNGDGTFTEAADESGVGGFGWQTGAAIGDVNGDGWNDLFVAGYVDINNRIPDATLGFPNTNLGREDLLYLSNGADSEGVVTFTNVAPVLGIDQIEPEYGLGAVLTDVDLDGDLDLYVANDTNPNRLYRNDASDGPLGFVFTEIAASAGVADEDSGMGLAIGDYDENGMLDTFITNFGDQNHGVYLNESGETVLYVNGVDTFGVEDLGVGVTGWGASFFDLDNDTDLDLLIANGQVPIVELSASAEPMQYLERTDGAYSDRSKELGVSNLGALNARGLAVADFDNDGDLDIAVSQIGGPLLILENAGPKQGFVTVSLDRFSPGAIVRATLADGSVLIREIRAGGSYLSSEDQRAHFGIGNELTIQVTVTWPDGTETDVGAVDANSFITVGYP